MQDSSIYVLTLPQELGFAGVQIGSHVNQWNLDAPQLQSVFAVSWFYVVPL